MGPHYAVVVTADAINRNASTVLLAVITSRRIDEVYPHEFLLPLSLLPKPSKVLGHSIVIWPKEELTQKNFVASLGKRDLPGLDAALMMALELWP